MEVGMWSSLSMDMQPPGMMMIANRFERAWYRCGSTIYYSYDTTVSAGGFAGRFFVVFVVGTSRTLESLHSSHAMVTGTK